MASRDSWLHRLNHLPWLPAALIAYYLPWVSHRAAALTLNAFDLAEWITLRPDVRSGTVPLLAPFLIRAGFAGLTLLIGLCALRSTVRWVRWGYVILTLLMIITLLPPPEFFRGAFDDPNYRQQAFIVAGTFALLGIGVIGWNRSFWQPTKPWLDRIIVLLIIGVALGGEILARNVMLSVGIEAPPGIGIVGFIACLGIWVTKPKSSAFRQA